MTEKGVTRVRLEGLVETRQPANRSFTARSEKGSQNRKSTLFG